ncbi:hypothetical protein DPMN_162620 [Dreissena polymorpha]|uniref:Uncharacterized protein n=1 Tax=Dreissena polymorpha TaxID=45954 RepID=A0A9D4ITW5_DREPO|nr:hypothetical protein DPMN_162620 [Dreissena polymorpha]
MKDSLYLKVMVVDFGFSSQIRRTQPSKNQSTLSFLNEATGASFCLRRSTSTPYLSLERSLM